jgi:hypothetical protein
MPQAQRTMRIPLLFMNGLAPSAPQTGQTRGIISPESGTRAAYRLCRSE